MRCALVQSVHPFSTTYPGSGHEGQQPNQCIPDVRLPANLSSSSWGNSNVFPGLIRYVIPLVSSGSTRGSPPSWMCPKNLKKEAPRRDPNQMPEPPQLAKSSSGSTLSSLRTSTLLTQPLRQSPAGGDSFWPLVSRISFCQSKASGSAPSSPRQSSSHYY